MSLSTPTTQEINDNILAQMEAALNQKVPLLPRAFVRVLAKTLAGVFVLLYKYAGFIFLQLFVGTASFRSTTVNGRTLVPLTEWGRLVGAGDPAPATNAELRVEIKVERLNETLPAGTQLVSAERGVTYITTAAVLLDAVTVTAVVRAVSDQGDSGGGAGVVGNLEPGAVLTFANPLASVSRSATVVEQVVTASDAESEADYRARVIARFQRRPQGGAYADYAQWGGGVAGIVGVYPYTSPNPGEVEVYVEATPESSGNADGIPTAAQLSAVYDSIQYDEAGTGLANRRPAGVFVNVRPIIRTGFDVEVIGLDVAIPGPVRDDITAAVREYMLGREPYIPGLSIPPRRDRVTRTAVASIVEDVVTAAGGLYSSIVLTRDGQAVDVYILGEGTKAKASTVIFT